MTRPGRSKQMIMLMIPREDAEIVKRMIRAYKHRHRGSPHLSSHDPMTWNRDGWVITRLLAELEDYRDEPFSFEKSKGSTPTTSPGGISRSRPASLP